jgi:hypothetical protein
MLVLGILTCLRGCDGADGSGDGYAAEMTQPALEISVKGSGTGIFLSMTAYFLRNWTG